MDCNIIRDLLPLYIDGCCSEESAKLVAAHLDGCSDCRKLYEQMRFSCEPGIAPQKQTHLRRVNDWKASVMQSVLLFFSFVLITIGVALEAKTPSGLVNGYWAVSLVIPATGFLLSLANWYFVRLYKTRKGFSNGSLFVTLAITLCAYAWACVHYEVDFIELLVGHNIIDFWDVLQGVLFFIRFGILSTAIFCILSKVLSDQYALLLGRE